MDYGAVYSSKRLSEVDRALKKTYRTAQRELRDKLAEFNKKFAEKSKKKKLQVESGEITEQEYKDWLTGQVFVRSKFEQQIRSVNAVLAEHNKHTINLINNARLDVFAEAYNFEAFKAEAEIVGSFNVYNTQSVARLILGDPDLLPKYNIDQEKDYIWNYQKVNNIVKQGIIQGESVDKITARLCRDLASKNEAKMRMFAITAIGSAEEAGRQKQMEDAAEMGLEVHKKWDATHDSKTRDSHRALDGTEIPFDHVFPNGCRFPKDPQGAPEEVYNCRCTMVTIYPKYENRSKPDYREGLTIGGKNYRDWKKWDNYGEYQKWLEEKKKKGEVQTGSGVDYTAVIKDIKSKLTASGFGEQIPEEYRKIIFDSLNNADGKLLDIVSKTAGNVTIQFMEENPGHNISHYTDGTGNITIITKDVNGEDRTPEDILRSFWHEYGHFVDDAAVSGSGFGYKSEYSDYFFHSIQSEILKDDKWMYAAVKDANELLKYAGLDNKYECRFENGMYSAEIFKDGKWYDARNPDFAIMDELEEGLLKWSREFSSEISLDDYRKQFGYPDRPERKDYIESYYTPKRQLYRERELFKGAGEAYNKAVREYYEKVDAFEKSHDMEKINNEWLKKAEVAKRRKEAVAPATDTFDGGVGGAFSAFILLGGHEPKYYAVNRKGAGEGVANVFSSLMTKNKDELDAMESLCPNIFNLIKGVIMK